MNFRRIKVFAYNIREIPWKLKHGIAFSAVLQDSTVDEHVRIHPNVRFYRSSIKRYSYIGQKSFVSDVEIGKFTSISEGCYIGGAAHPFDWVSTSLRFYCSNSDEEGIVTPTNPFYKSFYQPFSRTKIGNDVWVGARVLVLAGRTISDGAIIGAGSVVTKDIGPYEIWAGNPARMIRKRFPEETIQKLLDLQWWDWPEERIKEFSVYFNNVNGFIEKMNLQQLRNN